MQRKYDTTPTTEELDRRKAFYSDVNIQLRSTVGLKNFDLWNSIFPEFTATRPNISVPLAQKLSIVYTCLNVLGETRGSLPCEVKQNTSNGRVSVPSNPIYRLVHDRPNPFMTAFDFWATIEKLKKSWGNAYAEIIRDRDQQPTALMIRAPWCVTLSLTATGELYYLFEGRHIRHSDMLHFKNYSMNGYEGISAIKQNALSIGQALKLKEYNSNIIDNRPPGYLTTDSGKPKDLQTKANMVGMWTKKEGTTTVSTNPTPGSIEKVQVSSFGNLPLLYGGVKYVQLSLPADDVAYIEATELTNVDIYGIFRMPPTFGQDWKNTPYNGAEQQDLIFAKYTLASIRGDEQEMTEKLFPEANKTAENSLYIKFNLKGLLSGDHDSRAKFATAMFNIGALNANEIRELEDLPHYEGGDEYFVQGALVPMSKIVDYIDSMIAKNKAAGQNKAATVAETKTFLRGELKKRLNGHFKDVEEILQ